jgi:2-polyprenyl-3-methyl-5-hydroxy-6-metoxy-1,4-benzoquinol methylase
MIALDYDQLVEDDVKNNSFPYAAYSEMQDVIASYIAENKNTSKVRILDIGIGTASLYEKIIPEKYDLVGIDISKRMLEIAALKFPDAKLIPEEVKSDNYDYIVINYLFKHFDYNTMIDLINQFSNLLAPFGKIFIGDLMFLDESRRKMYFLDHPQALSYNYHFHTFNEITYKASDLLALSFMELNLYTGILIVEKYYESSLHFEECLVKYKSNTMKWKSSQSRIKRE